MEAKTEVNWPKALKPLIEQHLAQPHPLEYKNVYQVLVMVVLAAQDSDAKINKLAPELFAAFPNMKSLAKANVEDIVAHISNVRGHLKKAAWLQDIASIVKEDKNIPTTMDELVALKGIGRKSANVIMRESGVEPEGIMVDLHVIRVANRLGIADADVGDKLEKQLMEILPKKLWKEVGMALSFLGRETCRPTDPKHSQCVMSKVCAYFHTHNKGNC